VAFTRWLRIGWLIVAADFLYWISGLAYRGEEQQMSDRHATFNTVTYFGRLDPRLDCSCWANSSPGPRSHALEVALAVQRTGPE
jgi:hypothetical protein